MGTVHDATFSSSVLLVMMFFISFLFSSHSTHSLCAAVNFFESLHRLRALSLSLRECKPWPRGAGRFYRRRTRTRALIVATHAPAFWLLGACYALFALVVAAIRSRACFAAELVRRTSWATRAVLLFSTTGARIVAVPEWVLRPVLIWFVDAIPSAGIFHTFIQLRHFLCVSHTLAATRPL